MNERIEKLKESACPKIDWAARYHVELNNGEKEKWMNEWFEKFAELIVKECALIAGLMEHEGRKNIGAQILDNFGVAQSNIEIAESYHSDKGYSLGTPEAQESFERKRGYKL